MEETIKDKTIADLLSDKDNYFNRDNKCNCFDCELRGMCEYREKVQRLPRSNGLSLGNCYKLVENQYSLYKFIERHLEEYKAIVETRRNKREFVENDLFDILSKITDVSKIDYVMKYNEEYARIIFNNGSRKKICITGNSCLGILKDVSSKLLV